VLLSQKEEYYVEDDEHPCKPANEIDENFDYVACKTNAIENKIGCSLPWINSGNVMVLKMCNALMTFFNF